MFVLLVFFVFLFAGSYAWSCKYFQGIMRVGKAHKMTANFAESLLSEDYMVWIHNFDDI